MVKVLIVDDSQLIRNVLTEIVSSHPKMEVIGVAVDPYDAREKIKKLKPDVLTLDIEMPRMDGLTFLKNLMRLKPMPVVMISTLTLDGAEKTLDALEIGAVDYVAKPRVSILKGFSEIEDVIRNKIYAAAHVKMNALITDGTNLSVNKGNSFRGLDESDNPCGNSEVMPAKNVLDGISVSKKPCSVIAIGSSTGGTEALKKVLQSLSVNMPPIVVVQHMPSSFTDSFAKRLNKASKLTVVEFSENNMPLKKGYVYIANGAEHFKLALINKQLIGLRDDGEPVNLHKPAVDVLFDSVAEYVGSPAIGILLTGMGSDGAKGLLRMKQGGALTIAQDKESCVVWGMPRVAVEMDAVQYELPLKEIGAFLEAVCLKI
ncbi:chemotaxis response regulator protein-glutamate methylesterase [Marinibactrum halimedae]|uniref:Protein-glutamate methylesterase/protein-glutamine glutaminase n=2 Tax=Marinibactrum halimedae TaxID=1444977 RepID=A0AA37T0E0_9GAMM|nr:chemotaxis response regulator protein-glutamate methylesterase [Marinibactrum halimedae]GLS24405.1 chemotaxis response regulator protein-glutamate methylesterase 1 [Marinibactrum halimedae]